MVNGQKRIASDRAGRDDPDLDALVAAVIPKERRLEKPVDVPARVLGAFVPDTRADPPVRSLHRKVGSREVYLVVDAPKHSAVEFRARGQAEWSGARLARTGI